MLGSDFLKAQLCLQAWRDGGSEGINGALAVAFVIRYRQRAGWHGGNWVDLLSNHREYAAVNLPPQFDLPDPNNFTFGRLLQEIDGIFSGTREDDILTPNAALMGPIVSFDGQPAKPVPLYYGNLADPNLREWFLENISRATDRHSLIATVGTLSFFS